MPQENAILRFANKELGVNIRAVDIDGSPYFVGNDIADSLGYTRPRDAVRKFCKGGVKMTLPSASGQQETIVIPEADLYRLILRSKLPQAEAFQDWVVGDVLPQIRRNGFYATPQKIEDIIRDPGAFLALVDALRGERERVDLLEKRQELFGNRTSFGSPSKNNGRPRTEPVHGYLRTTRIITTTVTTEDQLRLFDWD